MIQMPQKARISCDHEDERKCESFATVSLVLMNNGSWAIDNTTLPNGWQVGWDKEKLAPYLLRCPRHAAQTPRVITSLDNLKI